MLVRVLRTKLDIMSIPRPANKKLKVARIEKPWGYVKRSGSKLKTVERHCEHGLARRYNIPQLVVLVVAFRPKWTGGKNDFGGIRL